MRLPRGWQYSNSEIDADVVLDVRQTDRQTAIRRKPSEKTARADDADSDILRVGGVPC